LTSLGLAGPGEPTALIKETTEKVLAILEDPQWHGAEKHAQRQERLRKVADTMFDWEEMARRALATHWRERTPEEQKEFAGLFTDLVERSYIHRLEGAVEQRQDILYLDEQMDGSRAVVKTKVVTKRNLEVPIEYRLHNPSGQWQIYDVVIEGVSLVNNYRSQFNRIIQSSSYKELIQKMKAKQAESSPGPERKSR
ncbi:MAG: ABC transporter substrate-binding protein, partial [Nitrospinae bacterium]|nr:ABC transporter substrate-binding protein [Nitrospinota bacterium]